MPPLFLIAAAFAILAILFMVIVGRYAERGLKLKQADETIADLSEKLEQALARQEKLTARVENLEAIVTSEAWDALPERQPSVALPEEPSNEEKSRQLARRLRT